jgi:hypothetical protein
MNLIPQKHCELLVPSGYGVYIPQAFAEQANLAEWGLADDDWDVAVLLDGPKHPDYFESWDNIINRACKVDEEGRHWHLEIPEDLWAVCPDLVDPED